MMPSVFLSIAYFSNFDSFLKFSDIIGLSDPTIKLAEELLEQITAEMHNYYVYEVRIPNYATRLVKLHQLINAAEVLNRFIFL